MTGSNPSQALARAASALVGESDLTHVLADVVADAAEVLAADAIGVLVTSPDHGLEVLSATSHRAHDLELYQAQSGSGPCVDAVAQGALVSESSADAIIGHWPDVGHQIVAAGYTSVHAFPMDWHGTTLGGLNVFHSTVPQGVDIPLLGQAFADIITSLILQPEQLSRRSIAAKVGRALSGRTVIEQAKGVLAYQETLTMDRAYDRLRELATRNHASLTDMASRILAEASRPAVRG
jgi:hypothetical protein